MRSTREIWAAWLVTLLGGLAVLAGALVLLTDPCRAAVVEGHCRSPVTRQVAVWIATGGGVAAATGVLAGLVLTVHNWRR